MNTNIRVIHAAMSIAAKVRTVLIDDLGLEEGLVAQGQLFSKGGLDSFDRIRLVDLLQERFGISIDWRLVVPRHFDSDTEIARLIERIVDGGNGL
jgi:acyl carrier protein